MKPCSETPNTILRDWSEKIGFEIIDFGRFAAYAKCQITDVEPFRLRTQLNFYETVDAAVIAAMDELFEMVQDDIDAVYSEIPEEFDKWWREKVFPWASKTELIEICQVFGKVRTVKLRELPCSISFMDKDNYAILAEGVAVKYNEKGEPLKLFIGDDLDDVVIAVLDDLVKQIQTYLDTEMQADMRFTDYFWNHYVKIWLEQTQLIEVA